MKLEQRSFLARQIHARPLAVFAIIYLLGLIVALNWRLSLFACTAAGAVALATYTLFRFHGRKVAAILMLVALLCGMIRMTYTLQTFPKTETQYSVQLTGRIISEPFTNPNTGRVISQFEVESIDGASSDLNIRLYLRGDAEALSDVAYGQKLSTVAHIWACDPVTNPYEFDFGNFLMRSDMSAYATAKIEDVTILHTTFDIQSGFIAARKNISVRIDALFTENAPLVRALILGDRTQLSEEMREALNSTGIAHLISISGLHVSTLAMLISALLGRVFSRKVSVGITLGTLLLYGGLIGFSASFVRALIMFALFSFAPMAGYPSDSFTRLCAAMLSMLIIRPLDILNAGFVLSFSSLAGILLLTPPLNALFGLNKILEASPPANPILEKLRNTALYFPKLLSTTIAAQLASLPAIIAFFGIQSIVSVPVNLICVPLCMLGYPIALVAVIISYLSMPLAILIALGADKVFSVMTTIAQWSAALPVTGIRIGRYPAILILLHAAIILAASNMSRIEERWRRFFPLGLIVIAGISSLLTYMLTWGFSIIYLDAGQADCAIIRTQGHTYMVDVGDTYTPAGDYLSATCLRLDGIFLSHPHQDHAGGLEDVLNALRPDVIYVPTGWFDHENLSIAVTDSIELAQSMNIDIIEIDAGYELELSRDTHLTVYSPDADNLPSDINDQSLLLSIEHGDQRALFTGDLSVDGEPAEIPDTDILKVAHHGSEVGTSQSFLEQSTPSIAIVPVGDNNYGHPSDVTLENLSNIGADIYRTDQCGTITLTLRRDNTWKIDTFLPLEKQIDTFLPLEEANEME